MLYRFLSPGRVCLYEADSGANPAGTTPAPDGNTTGQEAPPPANSGEKTFTQADLDRIIADRLAREEKKRTDAAEKARKDAEQKTLQEQGEYKTLAEQRAAELAAATAKLDAAKATEKTLERYQAALKAQLDTVRKDLPTHITALLDKLDPVDQLTWLAENQDALKPADPTPQQQQRPRGTPQIGANRQPAQPQNPPARKRSTL